MHLSAEQEVVLSNQFSFHGVLVRFMVTCNAKGGNMIRLPSLVFASLAFLGLLVSCSSKKGAEVAGQKDGDEAVKQPAKNLRPIPIDPLPAGAIARMGTTRWRVGRGFGLAFSPDGKYLGCASDPHKLLLMAVDSGKTSGDFPISVVPI